MSRLEDINIIFYIILYILLHNSVSSVQSKVMLFFLKFEFLNSLAPFTGNHPLWILSLHPYSQGKGQVSLYFHDFWRQARGGSSLAGNVVRIRSPWTGLKTVKISKYKRMNQRRWRLKVQNFVQLGHFHFRWGVCVLPRGDKDHLRFLSSGVFLK